jgi:hypothetical protein
MKPRPCMVREDFEAISRRASAAHLSTDDVCLFRAALVHGDHLTLWFRKAANAQVDTWCCGTDYPHDAERAVTIRSVSSVRLRHQ